MSITFISHDIWPLLTKVARISRNRSDVAVAYFGKGASRLLPLATGSRLVVDASERSVTSGQTCPADLITLAKRGVAVYSVTNLHAKVFVLGRAAYIGSANVSSRSSTQLVEALIRTTELKSVRAARQFVHDHCLYELTPTVLRRLERIYRPPHVPNAKPGQREVKDTARVPTLPRLLLAQLHLEDWSERDQTLHDSALVVAKKRREHPRSFELDSFRCTGRCQYQRDDLVIQVIDEGGGRVLVTPPGTVLHVRTRKDAKRQVSFIYLERPTRRRRPIGALAKALGRGARKRLDRDGKVRDVSFAQRLLNLWAN